MVRFEIEEQDLSSYLRAADFLNISNVDIVCLHHEFGIFGGRAGSHLLALLRELRMPVLTTLHTVLLEPNPDQRRVMQELITRSTRLLVMAERGRQMLQEIYHAPPAKIDLIPHGIPDIPFVDPNRSEEHTSELQSQSNLVCRLLLEKKKKLTTGYTPFFAVLLAIAGAMALQFHQVASSMYTSLESLPRVWQIDPSPVYVPATTERRR